jgi:uncharacterized membrane protein
MSAADCSREGGQFMDARRASAAYPRQVLPGRWSLASLALVSIVALAFFVGVALPYLLLDPAVLGRYQLRRAWLLTHVAAGSVALLTGPVQVWLGVAGRAVRAHRRLGMTYVTAVAVGAAAAFNLAAHTNLGWGFATGITGLGVAWVVTTALAVLAVRRGFIEHHRQWMIRSYTVTFAFVTFRVAWAALEAAGIGTRTEQLAASSWFCWAVPLLILEAVMNGRTLFGRRPDSLVLGDRAAGPARP